MFWSSTSTQAASSEPKSPSKDPNPTKEKLISPTKEVSRSSINDISATPFTLENPKPRSKSFWSYVTTESSQQEPFDNKLIKMDLYERFEYRFPFHTIDVNDFV